MHIRSSTLEDMENILALYAGARVFMKENGNPGQWGERYPPKELVKEDICSGCSYVCLDGCGEIAGVFFFRVGEDSSYQKIFQGGWLNEKPYGVIHRIAVSSRQKGVASFCLQWCFKQCGNVRVDTHRKNVPMQRLLEKNGFQYCGVIFLENGGERIAYQRMV